MELLNKFSVKSFEELNVFLKDSKIFGIKEQNSLFLFYIKDTDLLFELDDIKTYCKYNGFIFDNNMNIIAANEELIPEFKHIDEEKRLEVFRNSKIYSLEEGTQIRLYYYNNDWVISTTRSINCDKSFIPDETGKKRNLNYKDLFYDIVPKDFKEFFDKNKTYILMLKHPLDRRILYSNQKKLLYISSIDNRNLEVTINDDYLINNFSLITKFENIWESYGHFNYDIKNNKISRLVEHKGFIFVSPTLGKYKIIYENYTKIQELRGNNPNIFVRYLEIKDEKDRNALKKHYIECNFIELDKKIKNFPKLIHKLYLDIFVNKKTDLCFAGKYKTILFNVHKQYLLKRKRITENTVKTIINKMWKNKEGIKNLAFAFHLI